MNESKMHLHPGPKLAFPSYAAAYGWSCYHYVSKIVRGGEVETRDILEIIQTLLPCTIAFYSYLDAPEDHFLTASEIDPKLYNISVVERPRF